MMASKSDLRKSVHFVDNSLPSAPNSLKNLLASTGTALPTPSKSRKSFAKPRSHLYKPHKYHRLRMHLPGIEHYGKELEFHAYGSNRVTIRLERLMGSDRVRITDPTYMSTLLHELEHDEDREWHKRTAARRTLESNRARLLAIDGEIEPEADMHDILKHPVFRVNRILKRIQTMDLNWAHSPDKLPPIKSVEPFVEQAKTGLLFGSHPQHYLKTATTTATASSAPAKRLTSVGLLKTATASRSRPPSPTSISSSTTIPSFRRAIPNEHGEVVLEEKPLVDMSLMTLTTFQPSNPVSALLEWGGEDYVSSEDDDEHYDPPTPKSLSTILFDRDMDAAKMHYGIDIKEDLDALWNRHQSPLIQMLYDKDKNGEGTANDMFDFSKEVAGVYNREVRLADHFCNKVHRKVFT